MAPMTENVTRNMIQGDSGGKVNILGSDGIGHCEISSYEHVSAGPSGRAV